MALWLRCWNLSTKRVKLVVAYDGTDFCGFAPQAGQRSVQSTLTEAIRRVSGEEIEIIGASRTDAGAHALGQVVHFDAKVGIPPHGWVRAINDVMPSDIGVLSAHLVSDRFHARFSARYREYRYRIARGPRNPFLHRYCHYEWRKLDLDAMRQAATGLVGRHDFRAFTAELQPWVVNTYRELKSILVNELGEETQIEIRGTAFMRGMMRRIAGGLLEVGIGRRPPEHMAALTTEEGMARLELPVVLPAKGLTLVKVEYGSRLRDIREGPDEDE